jgi:hypothetical protein
MNVITKTARAQYHVRVQDELARIISVARLQLLTRITYYNLLLTLSLSTYHA